MSRVLDVCTFSFAPYVDGSVGSDKIFWVVEMCRKVIQLGRGRGLVHSRYRF